MIKKLLLELYGIGEQNVELIYEKLLQEHKNLNSITTMNKLRTLLLKSKIFMELSAATKADIMFNPCKEIPHEVLKSLEKKFQKNLKSWKFDFAGSYRRKTQISHDLDLVISRRGKQDLITLWKKLKIDIEKLNNISISEPFAQGSDKVVFILNFPFKNHEYRIKVDLFFVPPQEYIYMLLYATGSGKFNMLMRRQAKVRNLLLNQKGLFDRKTHKRIPVKSEKQIFEILGMKWRTPEERNL